VAAECEGLLKYPAPTVHFEEFGASSLDFAIRGFIADVTKRLNVNTELRLGIARAFREANIEIPFPQQDVHLRDLDGVREMVSKALAARAQKAAADAALAHGNDNSDSGDDKR
jgi:small-conductance mechanosensitive channel